MILLPAIQKLVSPYLKSKNIELDALRLDEVHPIISGNKWYKLKYYIDEAKENNNDTIATFGGAYSNHIVATAFAAKESGLQSVGIIRGEKPQTLSHTLQNAENFGMKLIFVSRDDYKNKEVIKAKFPNHYWIDEGGYGQLGAKGMGDIFNGLPLVNYNYIISAVGTGTTVAGIIDKMLAHQTLFGISVMKNNLSLQSEINSLLSTKSKSKNFELLHNYHFGGYAKKSEALLNFMNEVYDDYKLPLDFVYTAKAFYALMDLINDGKIQINSKVLFVHTGGLQGNLSLPSDTLKY